MSRHNHLNLPKIKVPDYNALSTPEATPNSSLFNSFPQKPPPISKIIMPNTPIQTPLSSSTNSFPPLPSLKSLGDSLLRPTSASNTTLPPLVLRNTTLLSSPQQPPKSPSFSLPPINEFSVPSPYSRPPQPLPQNPWPDQFYPTPNSPAYYSPYVPQNHCDPLLPHSAGLAIFVPEPDSHKSPQRYKNIINVPAGSREIKRRTKTGCMTCRKRRIKCDEQHPTCFNCKKSKRVCINYDPVFRAARLRRKLLAQRTVFGNGHARARVIKNKMDISSLLDAAAVIECNRNAFHSPSSSSSLINPSPWYELDNVCDQWDKVESFFALYIAPNLDSLFALTPTTRFAQMAVMNLARLSGLSLDGSTAITIPGSNGAARNSVAAHYGAPPPTPGMSPKEMPNPALSTCTARIGQSLAVLEVVRQLLVLLIPASFVFNDNLIIDESTVGKLEELRVSNDYKALRAVFQLLFGPADAACCFLEVSDKDNELLTKLNILNTFLVPNTPPPDSDISNPDISPVFAEMNQANELTSLQKLRPDLVWSLLAWLAQAGPRARLSEQDLQTSIRYASRQLSLSIPSPKPATIDTGAGSLEMALLLGIHHHLSTRPDMRPDPAYVKSLLLNGTQFWNQNLVMKRLVHLLG